MFKSEKRHSSKKRIVLLALLIWLICFFSCSAGENADAPKMIGAPEGTKTAIRVTAEDNTELEILGVESEPIQRGWSDFSGVFINFVKKNFGVDLVFSDAVWSDGEWIHELDGGSVYMRVFTTDSTDDGRIRKVLLTGIEPDEYRGDVQMLTGAAYWAAARYGDFGKYVMQIVFGEDHTDDWFETEPISIWLENGFLLQYGTNDAGYPYGEISFTEDLEVTGGY